MATNSLRSTKPRDQSIGFLPAPRRFGRSDGADHLRVIAYAPAIVIVIVVLAVELAFDNQSGPTRTWLPLVEVIAVMTSVAAGTLWFGWQQVRAASRAIAVLNSVEEERRTIAAIGFGTNWDLDLNRILVRFSDDLTALVQYDRLAITTARGDGRMQLDFVAGIRAPEDQIGSPIIPLSGSPDGLINPRDYDLESQLTVPISAIDGTITLRSRNKEEYGPGHVEIMRQVVAQISPGISNAIHYQESQHRVMERTALAEIGRAAASETDLDSILMVVSGALSNLMQFDHLGAILTDQHKDFATVVCWSSENLLGLNVGDRIDLSRVRNMSGVLSGRGIDPLGLSGDGDTPESQERLWMQVPLGEQANILGVIIVSAPVDATLGAEESDLLQRVANQVTPVIKNARLTSDLTKAVEERRAIAIIGRAASTELEISRIFAVVAEELEHTVPYDRFVATLYEPESDLLRVAYAKGPRLFGAAANDIIPNVAADDLRELRDNGAILHNDLISPRKSSGHIGEEPARESWVQVALGDSIKPSGYLSLRKNQANAYNTGHAEFLESISRQITPTLQNAHLFEQERALREQLDTQNKELHEANAAKSRFLSTVSHELKTPLTIISGFIDLLADDGDQSNSEHVEALDIMRKNSTRLALLINDVLDISRMDAGKLHIEPSVFLLNDLITELQKSFGHLYESKDQTLGITIPQSNIWLEADRNRIAQLATNLLSNAHKYSGTGCKIQLSVSVEDDNLTVLIEDEGIGISPGDQKQLFTAFFRADNEVAREVGGTGLGLVIARSIAELHGGSLWLNSIENQGTTVGFRIPGVTDEPVRDPEAESEQSLLAQRSRLYPDIAWEDIGDTA
ncbi:MAG: ATP-binding protein [Chloroflexi bacterium]|nr:ATP-binding protein [Chloroflexota bacterium]